MEKEFGKYNIRSVMHPAPYTIGLEQTLKTAREVMREKNIRHLPVMDGGQLKGILSDRDINSALRFEQKSPEEITVAEAYTDNAYVVDIETPLHNIAGTMALEHFGSTLVTENGKLVGIFTTVDACRVLFELLSGKLEQ